MSALECLYLRSGLYSGILCHNIFFYPQCVMKHQPEVRFTLGGTLSVADTGRVQYIVLPTRLVPSQHHDSLRLGPPAASGGQVLSPGSKDVGKSWDVCVRFWWGNWIWVRSPLPSITAPILHNLRMYHHHHRVPVL